MHIGNIYKNNSKTILQFDHGIKLCISDVIITTYENESGLANLSGNAINQYYLAYCCLNSYF